MHPTSLNKMKAFVDNYLKDYTNQPLTILDVGSQAVAGNPTYKLLFDKPQWKYLGLDVVDGHNLDIVVKDPYQWKEIEDGFADLVISGQAFEHIEFPWLTIKEIFRVLKDKGVCCIIAPSSGWEHRHPVDCWRIFPDGMRAFAKWTGFRLIEVFTDWGLDPWRDTFAVFQKPLTGSFRVAPFEEFSNKEVALNVYLEAFKDKPQSPEYYARAVNVLKSKGEITKSQIYMATALSMFPQNLWLRQKAVELYMDTDPLNALESVIFLFRARPITADNVRLIGRFIEKANTELRVLLYEQLPTELNQLKQFAHHSEMQKAYLLAEECWRRISELQPNDINTKLMYALMPRGQGKIEVSKERFKKALEDKLNKSILNRTTIIQYLINKHNFKTYLEIGVERGLNFFQIQADLKIGVDPVLNIPGGPKNSEGERFYSLTSDEFFKNPPDELVKSGIDICLIDGLHTYEQSLKDVENVLKYLNPDGIIVMHDCLPTNAVEAIPNLEEAKRHPEFKGFWTGDVYKTILHIRATHPELFVAVVNVDWGIGIIKRGDPENMLDLSIEQIKSMTFADFAKDKERLLNLKPSEWFRNFYLAHSAIPVKYLEDYIETSLKEIRCCNIFSVNSK